MALGFQNNQKERAPYMKMFYAGSASGNSQPEDVLKDEPNAGAMFTFYDVYYKKGTSLKRIKNLKKRKKKGLK